jgi:hypothetical protein
MNDAPHRSSALRRVLLALLIIGAVGMLANLALSFSATPAPGWTKAFLPLTIGVLGIDYIGWPAHRGLHAGTMRLVGWFLLAVAIFSLVADFAIHKG